MNITEQNHLLKRTGETEHQCIFCGKSFLHLTDEGANAIVEPCPVPRKIFTAGSLSISIAQIDPSLLDTFFGPASLWGIIPIVEGETPLTPEPPQHINARSVSNPVPDKRDSIQRKGDALADQIEEEWKGKK